MLYLRNFLIGVTLILAQHAKGQYPSYFNYSIENGAPCNELYWIIQDKSGYIWIGSDLGVYRFNGVRYEQFTSKALTSRAATGLIQSNTTQRIYGYNFNRQLFYIEKNKLYVIPGWNKQLNGLADDRHGNIWITGTDGVYLLNEKTLKTSPVTRAGFDVRKTKNPCTSHGLSGKTGTIFYQNGEQIITNQHGNFRRIKLDQEFQSISVLLSRNSVFPWVISTTGAKVRTYKAGSYLPYSDKGLANMLSGKKLNYAFESNNGKLWIGTYTGLICHDKYTKTTKLLHPQFAFSHGIQDHEGNFWFTTLHHGMIRIPNMQINAYYPEQENDLTEQYTHIAATDHDLWLGGSFGYLTRKSLTGDYLNRLKHDPLADLGMIYWDKQDQCLYFNKLSQLFKLQANRIRCVNVHARPIKNMLHHNGNYFMLSSQGLYVLNAIHEPLTEINLIDPEWYRDICISPFSNTYFLASNKGVVEIQKTGNKFRIQSRILGNKQIISIGSDPHVKKIYFLTFDGQLYCIDQHNQLKLLHEWKNDIRISQLLIHKGILYLASNKGLVIFNPKSNHEKLIDRSFGLASNHVRSIAIQGNTCWAVGVCAQRIPLDQLNQFTNPGRILHRAIYVNGKPHPLKTTIELQHHDKLAIQTDAICYRSAGDFQFAYRIIGSTSNWITLPGNVKEIDFASLPTGKITIEVKVIDHLGRNSINHLTYSLNVIPPFWQRWWFYLTVILAILGSTYGIFRWRLNILRKRQFTELSQLKLKHALRLTQQHALKAQMNPHFLFNVLNSIKGFIYDNDKKNAAKYLNEFSSLVRKVLELSAKPMVTLEEELEALALYIDLEGMLLEHGFTYAINIEPGLDTRGLSIPALLIQPFVENAFKHGLRHKKGPKSLTIHIVYQQEESILEIRIIDNGIGREAAEKLNQSIQPDHQSFASGAIKKRIDLLNFERKDVIGVEFQDIFEGTTPSGTEVSIRIHV